MKYLYKNDEICIQCHQCEITCANKVQKSDDLRKSAIKINGNAKYGEEKINVCDQCGECIEVCSEMALGRAKNGVVLLDKKKCVGCLICVGFCSKQSMRIHDDMIEPFKCIACGQCVSSCPVGALEIREK